MKNIVIIGGGTGTFTLLAGLRKYPTNNSVIVSTADDGGSTGVLRRELGVMPVGDIRQCLVGLSYTEKVMRDLFSYRFDRGSLAGHTVGNIILAGLERITGDIEKAIGTGATMLNARGAVIPVTRMPTVLSATYADGRKVSGEHHIDEPERPRSSAIRSLSLSPSGPANPRALAALAAADAIIFGPGDLYTSVLPNLLVKGVAERIRVSRAKKIVVTNIMTKRGQTDGFQASDFVRVLAGYLDKKKGDVPIDIALVNNKKPASSALTSYRKEHARYVVPDEARIRAWGVDVVATDLLSRHTFRRATGDRLPRSFLRHDSDKTARAIWKLISSV